jgi:hypothetical protein
MGRVLVPVISLAAALWLGGAAYTLSSRGHPVTLPLDDAYIYLQYARTATQGHPGAYFPGEGFTTGATSLLWAGLATTAAGLVRATGTTEPGALPTAALILNALSTALTFWLAYRLARKHGAGVFSSWAAPLVCVLAPFWFLASFNGMDTGLYGAALLGGAWALSGGSPAWLILLVFARPEGALLAVLLLLGTIIRRRNEPVRRLAVPVVLVTLAILAAWSWPRLLTGAAPAAWPAKSLWLEPDPEVRGFYFPRLPYFAARALWFGLSGARPQPPLEVAADVFRPEAWRSWVHFLFLGGGALLAVAGRRAYITLVLWILASLSVLAAVAWDAQFYRYLFPAYALLAVTATAGWFGVRPRNGIPGLARTRRAAGALIVIALLLGAAMGPRDVWTTMRLVYRGECERIEANQVRVGRWIGDHLPPEARVATHDVGAIAFAGGRPVVDLVGLVTPPLTLAYRHGEGAIWEALQNLPPEKRPTHAAVIPAWMPYLSRTGWFGDRLWSAEGRERRRPVSQDFEVRELSWPDTWPGGDFGGEPRLHGAGAGKKGWKVVDALDVADLASEHEHRFRTEGPAGQTLVRDLGFEPSPPAAARTHAVEGGRDIEGPVTFRLRAGTGFPALLVLRTASAREVTIVVHVGGRPLTLTVPRGEDRYREPALFLPQEVMDRTGGNLSVRVDGAGYRVFHFWLLQPRPARARIP